LLTEALLSLTGGFLGYPGFVGVRLLLPSILEAIPRIGEDGSAVTLDRHPLHLRRLRAQRILFGLVLPSAYRAPTLPPPHESSNRSSFGFRSGKSAPCCRQ